MRTRSIHGTSLAQGRGLEIGTASRRGLVALGALLAVPALTAPASAAEAELRALTRIELAADGRELVLDTDGPAPKYRVFEREGAVHLDLAGTRPAPELSNPPAAGPVSKLSVARIVDGSATVTRISLELKRAFRPAVRADGHQLVLRLDAPAPTRIGRVKLERSKTGAKLVAPLTGGTLSSENVHLETLEKPARLVVDIEGASVTPKWQRVPVGRAGVRRARIANHGEAARMVLDLDVGADFPKLSVDVVGDQLELSLEARPAPVLASQPAQDITPKTQPAPSPEVVAEAAPMALPVPVETSAPSSAAVSGVRFEPKDGFYRLTVDLASSAPVKVARAGTEDAPVLRIAGVRLPPELERTMDVSAVAGEALSSLSSFNDAEGVVLSARIESATEHRHWQRGNRLMWDFRSQAPKVIEYADSSVASYGADAARAAGTIAPQRQRYSGRRISLDLKDADIQNVLRLLADVSKLNIVASEDVKGTITIKLRNVPWDQALDVILRAKRLDKIRNGNIIRIAPIEVLAEEERIRGERMRELEKQEPTTVRLIPVSYAVARDVVPQVQALLSAQGTVNVDTRTNVLIVEDIADVLTKVERLVRTLDTQTPQVLIEARIVEARSNFSRELGVQWGGSTAFTQSYGNQTGLSFPGNVRIAGGADDNQTAVAGVVPSPNYAVNLPAAVGSGGGGALGFVFGSLNGSSLISLRLSAAEAAGKIKIVSAPKIVTLDNKEAKILSGERVPITVVTANGPTTRFIDANIELRVLPHVTQDGSILMEIRAKKNELSDRVDFLGVPGVLTKEAETQMIVKDGDTAVLGGLYRRTSQENEAYVPWVGRIPVLGWLFKTTSKSDARDELLIFISPRIVNRSAALIEPE